MTDSIRRQRDRFVAFAFAGADLLLEVGPDGCITFCAGASRPLFGLDNSQMLGRDLFALIAPQDHFTLREALVRLGKRGRFDRLKLTGLRSDGSTVPSLFSGIQLPDRSGLVHLTIAKLKGSAAAAGLDDSLAPPQTPGSFVQMVEQRLKESFDVGDDYAMTLLDLSQGEWDGLEPEQVSAFLDNVEGYLKAWSVGGESVGRLDDSKFGIIHEDEALNEDFNSHIEDMARKMSPETRLSVSSASLEMTAESLTPQDVTKALIYTINRFVSQGGQNLSIGSLTDGYRQAVGETLARVNSFRHAIHSERFVFVFQPVVSLGDFRIHHYEALARFLRDNKVFLPSRIVSFAEDVGVVSELDMVACRKALQVLRQNAVVRPTDSIAVNLSGRSIASSAFLADLLSLLKRESDLLPRLMFEITESSEITDLPAANAALTMLRKLGCAVCLDDFGAGAAAFQYLRALEVDYVKIDGSYIQEALGSSRASAFLKAMAALCHDLGIKTVGERVEDRQSIRLLREAGVNYGQGYYFARPRSDVSKLVLNARWDACQEEAV
ncbi:EAL domain-containing protein [Telmatospirillum sp. J64-1]|uniref:sensor domain-containing phosphodiesterase n=1 Tax=Telmatospirillum sp. J64-1 TaxID=2502183 RepID=UPI00115D5821|nr:EAL domain-containing protein [Telmatospirillum sp. J64-1]